MLFLYFTLVSISFDSYRKIPPGILEEHDEMSSEEQLNEEDHAMEQTKQPGIPVLAYAVFCYMDIEG